MAVTSCIKGKVIVILLFVGKLHNDLFKWLKRKQHICNTWQNVPVTYKTSYVILGNRSSNKFKLKFPKNRTNFYEEHEVIDINILRVCSRSVDNVLDLGKEAVVAVTGKVSLERNILFGGKKASVVKSPNTFNPAISCTVWTLLCQIETLILKFFLALPHDIC